jgi:hypothetical protein
MTRWNGSYLGNLKNTSLQDSGGIWNLKRQTLAKQLSTWPLDNSVIPIPSWTLDFSSGTPSGYTLTRSGTGATFVNSSGYIEAAGENVARLTHNSSGTRLGLLVEESRTNTAQRSEDFGNAYWTKNKCSITANNATSPDNTTTADLIVEDSATGFRGLNMAGATLTGGNPVCASCFVKKPSSNGRNCVGIAVENLAGYFGKRFDLTNGTVVGTTYNTNTAGNTNVDFGIEDYGNGWYRCWVSATLENGNGVNMRVSPMVSSTTTFFAGLADYAGDGASGILVWGAQQEAGAKPTAYIPTPSGSVTRSADLAHILDENITSWSDPGALVIHFYQPGQAGTLISTDDATNQQLGIKANTTTTASSFWSSGETSTGTIGSISVNKAVHYWDGTTSKFCINGGSVVSGTNNITTFSNIDYITLGAEATSSTSGYSQYANCIIRKVEFYPGQLDNEKLQLITNNTYNIEYLVVAGGGGGSSGGGGAGGYRTASGFTLTVGTSYTVTVGGGGSGSVPSTTAGTSGNNSVFSTITSTGGGGGQTIDNVSGISGGSGGGGGSAGSATTNGGSGTSGEGNAGGGNGGFTASPFAAGGGGGASAVGTNASSATAAGNGGNGSSSSISGSSLTYAGGGGGGIFSGGSHTAGSGGTGGGGAGKISGVSGNAGTANRGGGGGGSGSGGTGGSGGSGVVILRIPTINYTGIIIGNPTVTTNGEFTILTFNGSGSYTA